jgi:hypothetical protein
MSYELAWAAGFFDGEGCVGCSWRPEKRYRNLRLSITQVDREVLDRFAEAVGVGRVLGPRIRKDPNQQPLYTYRLDRVEEIRAVREKLWPWLGTVKRLQFDGAILLWDALGVEHNITRRRPYGPRRRVHAS